MGSAAGTSARSEDDPVGSSAQLESSLGAPRGGQPTAAAPPSPASTAPDPATTPSSSLIPVATAPSSPVLDAGEAPTPQRPTTRLQAGITKPKQFTDGTVRYGLHGNFCATGEPESFHEALREPKWKCDALKIHQIKSRARVFRLKTARRQNPSPNPF
jgi:hypothetical protein